MTARPADRIAQRLRELGLSPREASRRARRPDGRPLSPDAVRTILRRPDDDPRASTVAALAPVLERSIPWLLGVTDDPDGQSVQPPLTLPIRYAVAAGTWLEHDDSSQAEPEHAPIGPHPDFPGAAQFVVRIEGDSMNLIWPPAALLRCVDAVEIGYEPKSGDRVVIERRRPGLYERSVKELVIRSRGRIEAWPRSTNPRFQSPLVLNDGAEEETEVAIVALALDALLDGGRNDRFSSQAPEPRWRSA